MGMMIHHTFQRNLILFLQLALVLFGLGVFIFLLWEPHLEGRNEYATWFQIYFNDPILIYAYTGAIAFFVGLYNTIRLLGYVALGTGTAEHPLAALKRIKVCALIVACFALGFEVYLFMAQRKIEEDIAGGMAMGHVLLLGSIIVVVLAGVSQKALRRVSRQ